MKYNLLLASWSTTDISNNQTESHKTNPPEKLGDAIQSDESVL